MINRQARARGIHVKSGLALIAMLMLGTTAEPMPPDAMQQEHTELPAEQQAFWDQLSKHCGKAYPGKVSDTTEYYREALAGKTLAMDVISCEAQRIHIALHVDEDRSRNWILTRSAGTLRLKHEHREADGSESTISRYGGDAPTPGLPSRQIFPADAHTASILPERADNFWFIDFVDQQRLQYGVHWPRLGHSIRLEFKLDAPLQDAPLPAPWGYEQP